MFNDIENYKIIIDNKFDGSYRIFNDNIKTSKQIKKINKEKKLSNREIDNLVNNFSKLKKNNKIF